MASRKERLGKLDPQQIADSYASIPIPKRSVVQRTFTGRPSKLTPDLMEQAVRLVEEGNYLTTVAGALGLNYQTWRNWMERGEREAERWNEIVEAGGDPTEEIFDTIYIEFFVAVTRAEHVAEANAVKMLKLHGLTDARAVVEYLQRRHRKRWTKETKISGGEGGPLVVKVVSKEEEDDAADA